MYAALWRSLAGPTWVRALTCVVLVAAVVAACFLWAFPALAPLLPVNDGTVNQSP